MSRRASGSKKRVSVQSGAGEASGPRARSDQALPLGFTRRPHAAAALGAAALQFRNRRSLRARPSAFSAHNWTGIEVGQAVAHDMATPQIGPAGIVAGGIHRVLQDGQDFGGNATALAAARFLFCPNSFWRDPSGSRCR